MNNATKVGWLGAIQDLVRNGGKIPQIFTFTPIRIVPPSQRFSKSVRETLSENSKKTPQNSTSNLKFTASSVVIRYSHIFRCDDGSTSDSIQVLPKEGFCSTYNSDREKEIDPTQITMEISARTDGEFVKITATKYGNELAKVYCPKDEKPENWLPSLFEGWGGLTKDMKPNGIVHFLASNPDYNSYIANVLENAKNSSQCSAGEVELHGLSASATLALMDRMR